MKKKEVKPKTPKESGLKIEHSFDKAMKLLATPPKKSIKKDKCK
jgi:hypothetical protein